VISSAERIDRMIGDLLDYTRARAGAPISRRPTTLADCCREIVDAMQALHPRREFRLSVDGDTAGEWDHDRILRLISNLLTNAVSYGSASSPIAIAARGERDAVELSVHNDGKPIPAERIPHLFDAFTRAVDAETAQRHHGLGLGLYIVREIAHKHGGTVHVTSNAPEGTTFTVRLPRK
jgi:signal transduction histidine kinase